MAMTGGRSFSLYYIQCYIQCKLIQLLSYVHDVLVNTDTWDHKKTQIPFLNVLPSLRLLAYRHIVHSIITN